MSKIEGEQESWKMRNIAAEGARKQQGKERIEKIEGRKWGKREKQGDRRTEKTRKSCRRVERDDEDGEGATF